MTEILENSQKTLLSLALTLLIIALIGACFDLGQFSGGWGSLVLVGLFFARLGAGIGWIAYFYDGSEKNKADPMKVRYDESS